jgi:hypothetical protein
MSHTPKIPKEFTPGFSLTEKPTIPVVIDRSHPITRGMRAAFVFSMPGVSKQWDIWNERFADITNGEGQGVYAGRSSYYFNANASEKIDLSYIGNFLGSSKISVYSRMYYNNNAIDHALIDFNSQKLVFWADTSEGNLSPAGFANGSAKIGTSGVLNGPAWVSWGACGDRSVSTSTIADYYVNGTIDVSAQNLGTADWTRTSNIAIANRWTGAPPKASDAYYEYFYLWDRELSPEEFKSINDEPYQILKPAIDVTYFYPSAATTSAPYVLPKEFTPGYGTKDVSQIPLVIDESNPLSKGVVFAVAFKSSFYDRPIRGPHPISNSLDRVPFGVSQSNTDIIGYDRNEVGINVELGSAAFNFKARGSENSSAKALITTDAEFQIWKGPTDFNFSIGNQQVTISSTKYDVWGGDPINVMARWSEADTYRSIAYNEEINVDNTSFAVTPGSSDLYFLNRGDGARNTNADSSYLVIWDRVLTDAETIAFNENPYQIFKPAIDVTYFYPSAATTSAPYVLPKEFTPGFSITRKPTGAVALEKRGDAWMFNMGYPSINGDTPSSIPASSFFGVSDDAYYANTGFNQALTYSGGVIYGDMHCLIYDVTIDRATVTSSTSSYVWVVIGDFRVQIGSNTGFMTGETITYYDNTDTAKKSGVAYDLTDGVRYVIVFRFNGSNYDIFINGQEITPLSSSSEVNAIISASGTNEIYSYHGVSAPQQLNHFVCAITEPVSKAEAISLSKAPYQILKPAIDVTYFTATAGGDTNISATLATLTISEQAATVSLDIDVSTNVDALTISEQAATVSLGINVSTNVDALTISEQAATVSLDVDIATNIDSLTISEQAATVSLGINVSTNVDALTISEQAATVALNVDVATNLDTLVITEQQAIITTGNDVNVAATTDALVISEQSATISLDRDVATNLDTLVVTENQASITLAVNVSTNLDTLTISEQAATVVYDVDVAASLATLTISEQAAAITGIATNITTTLATVTLTNYAANVALTPANDFTFTTGVTSLISTTAGASSQISNTTGAASVITTTKGITSGI